MDPSAPSYIERAADRDLLAALLAREYVFLLDSRQKGKSSLVARTIVRLRESEVVPVRIDLQRIGANVTPEQWYAGMLSSIGQDLGLSEEAFEYWERLSAVGPLSRWIGALREVVLEHVRKPIVIFIDEIDFVRALPFSADEFFAGIRDCFNRRADDPEFGRLTFCLVGVATPGQLIRNAEITPFNIGRRIELEDFRPNEQTDYAAQLDGSGRSGGALLERIGYWVNGHPYLTQLLCSRVLADPAIVRPADLDEMVRREFLTPEARQREPNLSDVERRLLDLDGGSNERRAQVLEHFGKLLSGKRLSVPEENPVGAALRLSGVAVEQGGLLQIRNRLYASIFNESWRRNALPNAELRRQKAAYRRGVLGTTIVASAVLFVIGALYVQNLRLSSERSRALADSRASANRAEREAYDRTMALIDKEAAEGKWMSVRHFVDGSRDSPFKGWEWSFWDAMVNDCVAESNLGARISAVCPQPDGSWIVAAEKKGLFRIHAGSISTISDVERSFWNTGVPNLLLALNSENGQYSAIDARTGQVLYEIGNTKTIPNRNSPWLSQVDGTRLNLLQLEASRFTVRDEIRLPENPSNAFVSPSGRFILLIYGANGYALFDRQTRTTNRNWERTFNSTNDVAFLDKEKVALIASGSPYLIAVDTKGRQPSRNIANLDAPVYSIQPSRNWDSLFLAAANGTASEVAWPSGKVLRAFRAHLDGLSLAVTSLDGRSVLTGGIDGSVRLWQRDATTPVWTTKPHTSEINMARLNADASRAITTSSDGYCHVFDVRRRTRLFSLEIGSVPPPGLLLLDSQKSRAVVGGSEGRVWLIDLASARVIWHSQPLSGGVCSGVLSSSREIAAVGDWLGNVAVLDLASGEALSRDHVIEAKAGALGISPEGDMLAIGTARGLFVSPLPTLAPRFLDGPYRPEVDTRSLAYSSSRNEWLVCRVYLPEIRDRDGSNVLRTLKGHTHRVFQAVYSPSERLIATISYDGTAKIWDAESGTLLHSLRHESWVSTIEFSADESRVLTSSADRTVRIWRVDSGEQVTVLQNGPAEMVSASFSDDGLAVVTGCIDGSVRVFSTKKTKK